jgi:thiamine pyrophosphate-dependent acetolactate synthase large subunit-like protein
MGEKEELVQDNGSEREVNIAEWIANAIADTGCTVVYGGHGGALVPLVNAVCANPALTWVCARNEHDAATMAAAHAKMTGGLGCVIATSGPGATNLTTGLMEASMDKVSLLAITGMKPTAQLGYSEFQDVNQSRLFAGAGIEWSKDAASPDAVIPLLRDAVATALSRRTTAHLASPVDIQAAKSPLKLKHFCASHADLRLHSPRIDDYFIDKAATELVGIEEERAPRNIIAVGLRAVYPNTAKGSSGPQLSNAILDLAEALNAPVLTRLHAKGVVDETHPLTFGVIGVHGKPGLEAAASLISTSDCVLCIGVEDASLLLCNSAGLQIRKLIEVQPDAVAVGTRYNAEHTLLGDIEKICKALTARAETLRIKVEKKRAIHSNRAMTEASLDDPRRKMMLRASFNDKFGYMAFNNPTAGRQRSISGSFTTEVAVLDVEEEGVDKVLKASDELWDAMHVGNWRKVSGLRKAAEGKQNYKFILDREKKAVNYCHPSDVLYALSDLRVDPETDPVSRDAVITVDVGDVTLWASFCLHLHGGSRTLYSERLGTMGYALNAAIAGILCKPEPAGAVVLAGDGGFQMSLQELATFQQMKRPGDKLLCIVFDNQVLGRVVFGFENAKGCEMIGPDYVALAKAYGGDGIRLDDCDKAAGVMKQALAADGLFLIHVIVDPEVKADMATFKDNALKVMASG